jgi:hypothetical protein
MQILIEYDYVSPPPAHGYEYYILDPTIIFCMRKIVYVSDGPLITPTLPLAIRLAAQDYHIHHNKTINDGEDFGANCRTMLEMHTVSSMLFTAIAEDDSPLKLLRLIRYSSFKVFYAPKMLKEMPSTSDKRVVHCPTGCLSNRLDS